MADQTLAQRIRAKFPGSYDDLSDADLERMIDEKFPGTYADIPRTQSATPSMGRNLLRQGGSFARSALGGIGAPLDPVTQAFGAPPLERGLTAIGLPEPQSATERVIYDINKGAAAAATSAGVAGAAAPTTQVGKGIATTLATRPGSQIVSAGTAAGASGVTREAGGGPGAQLAVGLAAGVATGAVFDRLADKLTGMSQANWKPEYRKTMDASEEFDVPVSYGDVRKGATVPKVETTLEQVPGVGMGGFRQAQHDKALAAAQQFKDDFGTGSGPEWAEIAQNSLQRRVGRMRQTASSMYDELGQLAADKAVPIGRTLGKLDDEIGRAQGSIMGGDLAPKLQRWRESVAAAYRKGNFEKLREFRSDLGDAIRSTQDYKELRILNGVKRALESDLEEFARKEGGTIWDKWRAADRFYATELVPARRLADRFAKIEDPDALYRAFLSAAGKTPQTLYNAMGAQSRAAVQYGMVNEAFERGISSDGTKFSPAKFAKYLEDQQRAAGVFFEGEDKARLDAFVSLMRHAQRGGQYMENPPTGNRWLVNLLTLGAIPAAAYAPGSTATSASVLFGLKSLFTTETGKRLLMTVSKHPNDAQYIDGALRFYAPALGAVAAQSSNPEPQTGLRAPPPRPATSSAAPGR